MRAYRETLLASLGWTGVFPLWGEDTAALARRFIHDGYRAILTCVDTTQLAAEFAGREFDVCLLADLPDTVDPCGERGEFHTCVYAGPPFAHPLPLVAGERLRRDERFEYCDVLLAPAAPRAGARAKPQDVSRRPPWDRPCFCWSSSGAAGLLSATQAWAIAARPTSRVRYAGAWLVSTAGLTLLVLLVFGAGEPKLPRDIVRTTMVLAAITAGIALWAGHRVAAPAGLPAASYGQRFRRLLLIQAFILVPLGALDGCALLVVGLGRIH